MQLMKQHNTNPENSAYRVNVLAVDDDENMLELLKTFVESLGYSVITASDGKEALNLLLRGEHSVDLILMDQVMPEMTGLEVVVTLKQDPVMKDIPIIMLTGDKEPEQIKKGIDAGVYYYLTKPINSGVLYSVVSAAIRDINQRNTLNAEINQHLAGFSLMDKCSFKCSSLQEAESLACFIANFYPVPSRAISGLAELLINAVEHGNLEIGYEKKTDLLNNNNWREEVLRRGVLPENKDKQVAVKLQRNEDGIYITISDQGKGFEWHKYMQVDPARAQDNHGRGIAQANAMSFDRITYNDKGNQVTAFTGVDSDIGW
ncbi:MAG: response regulator [Gammaproteobacteria bacterium]|nr:response regulator [Gammaproteobacteria bacterium]MDH5777031.1 response regulator [Gammaproteobacteria bacterium]